MTIIIGAVHEGSIYVGADTLWSWHNNFVREMKTSKFLPVKSDSVLIAGAGEERLSQIFSQMVNDRANQHLLDIKDQEDVIKLAREFYDEVNDMGVGGPKENEMPDHNFGFLVVKAGIPKLWVIESDYAVIEFDSHVCLGCGAELGESAMSALAKVGIHGEKAVELAVQTVNELHPFCGGSVELKTLKPS